MIFSIGFPFFLFSSVSNGRLSLFDLFLLLLYLQYTIEHTQTRARTHICGINIFSSRYSLRQILVNMVKTSSASKKRPRDNSPTSEESESENEFQVEAIVDKRTKGKRVQYLLKWKGYSDADNTVKIFR